MSSKPLNIDERQKEIMYRVGFIMYIITWMGIIAALLYRQFVLQQDIAQFEDLAILSTFNGVVFIAALLFFWGMSFKRIKLKTVISVYALMVFLGFLFTYVKYNIFLETPLSVSQIFDKLGIVATIIAIILIVYYVFGYLGEKRLERSMEE
ncbi:MAG: hypothetical protein SCALA702_29320 [Melioribacteraceae bacterium]|nr:MAG: hypothetical protein SCALA702_29320 [Melioribacteraceae bacterium]